MRNRGINEKEYLLDLTLRGIETQRRVIVEYMPCFLCLTLPYGVLKHCAFNKAWLLLLNA